MARLKIQRNRKSRNGNPIGSTADEGINADGLPPDVGGVDNDGSGTDAEIVGSSDTDSGDTSGEFTVPGDIAGTGSGSPGGDSAPRKRGRPKGSGSGRVSPKKTASDLDAILFHAHLAIANFASIPELELSEEESQKYAAAAQRVVSLYSDIVYPEKTMAWIQLALCVGGIYGPRYVAANMRMKKEKRAENKPQETISPQTITPQSIGLVNFPTGAAHA